MELHIVNPVPKYSKAKLVEPTTLGYIYVAAVRPGPMPLVLPSAARARRLVRLLVRGEQEITAGTEYDLDEVRAEADALLKDEAQ